MAVAQPGVMSAVAKLPGEYLPEGERARGISLASAAGFLGMLAALLLGPLLGGARLELLLEVQAAVAVLAAGALALALRRPGSGAGERTAIEGGIARRRLWARPENSDPLGPRVSWLWGVRRAVDLAADAAATIRGLRNHRGRALGGDDRRGGGGLRGAAGADRAPRG